MNRWRWWWDSLNNWERAGVIGWTLAALWVAAGGAR